MSIDAHDQLSQTTGNEIYRKYLGIYLNETLSVATPKLVTHPVLPALMLQVADTIENEFIDAAEERGDDPQETLSRLMFEYVREDGTISELLSENDSPVDSLAEYDPADDRLLGEKAIKELPTYRESVRIDPDDISDEEMPQDRDLKRSLILGVLRYRLSGNDTNGDRQYGTVVWRDDVAAAAQAVMGSLDTDYKYYEYVEQVLDEALIRNPANSSIAFFSASGIQQYLESLEPRDYQTGGNGTSLKEGVQAEDDVWELTDYLVENHSYQVEIDKLNEIRARFGLGPVDRSLVASYRYTEWSRYDLD